jgi:rRNA pseudouridine-1189 N-methylase Emg1 (Nep1/Mra1 family)
MQGGMMDKIAVYTVWLKVPDPETSNVFIGAMNKILSYGIQDAGYEGLISVEDSTLIEILEAE